MLKLQKLIALIAIGALSFNSSSSFGIQGRGNSKKNCTSHVTEAELQAQNLSEISCKAELTALKCDEFFETAEDRKEFERQCPPSKEERQINGGDLGAVCLRQMFNPTIDSIKGVAAFIAAGMKASSENQQKFISECETSPDFKSKILKTIPDYTGFTKEQIRNFPCSQLAGDFQDSESRHNEYAVNQRSEAAYNKYVSTPHTDDDTKVGRNPFLAIIQHNKDKWKCLNQSGHYEMICYVLFSIVDPTMVAGGAVVGAKAVRLTRLFNRVEDVARADRATEVIATAKGLVEVTPAVENAVPAMVKPAAARETSADFKNQILRPSTPESNTRALAQVSGGKEMQVPESAEEIPQARIARTYPDKRVQPELPPRRDRVIDSNTSVKASAASTPEIPHMQGAVNQESKLSLESIKRTRTYQLKDTETYFEGTDLNLTENADDRIKNVVTELNRKNVYHILEGKSISDNRPYSGLVKENYGAVLFIPKGLKSDDELYAFLKKQLEILDEPNISKNSEVTSNLTSESARLLNNAYTKHNVTTSIKPAEEMNGAAAHASGADKIVISDATVRKPYEAPTVIHEITHTTTARKLKENSTLTQVGRAIHFEPNDGRKVIGHYSNFQADEFEARIREAAYEKFEERAKGQRSKYLMPSNTRTLMNAAVFKSEQKHMIDRFLSNFNNVEFSSLEIPVRNPVGQVSVTLNGQKMVIDLPRGAFRDGSTDVKSYVKGVLEKRIQFLDSYEKKLPHITHTY